MVKCNIGDIGVFIAGIAKIGWADSVTGAGAGNATKKNIYFSRQV